jgi:hypothetical protein
VKDPCISLLPVPLFVIPEGNLLLHFLAVASAVASEIGPGFSPDIPRRHNMGFSHWDMLSSRTTLSNVGQ